MRGKFVKKIERPKGYVNIDEVYEQLDSVEKEEDCEYGDFGEVLSKWATCDYGEVLEAISCCDVVKAVTLDRIKQVREEIDNLYEDFDGYDPNALCEYSSRVDEILDRLIESEG